MPSYSNFRQKGNQPQYRDKRNGVPAPPDEVKALSLPDDYVDDAEAVMRSLSENRGKPITTSKIRNIFSLVSDIYNTENLRDEPKLLPESRTALTMMRIRVVYEAGREESVKEFVKKAKLLEYIKGIGDDREKLIDFAHYMEALVAYHRYLIGGREG
ncbi:MAG: type III-A CRISPR-associated protein Csm2 [Clostridia bacterium]|nr:type III-A CRISPR-associated protein Csm2 [Clostridia bacterium]